MVEKNNAMREGQFIVVVLCRRLHSYFLKNKIEKISRIFLHLTTSYVNGRQKRFINRTTQRCHAGRLPFIKVYLYLV